MFRKTILLVLLLSECLISFRTFSQSNYATLGGTISDPQQRPIARADVALTSVSTRVERRVTANDEGFFQMTGLLPGEYELLVRASGFAMWSRKLNLEVGQQATVEVNLTIASVSGAVEVSTQAAEVLRTSDASVGDVIEPAAIQQLPINGRTVQYTQPESISRCCAGIQSPESCWE
jgi:Carboxypeptidase regulatory-like domain